MIIKSLEHQINMLSNQVEVKAVLEFSQNEILNVPAAQQKGLKEILQFIVARDFTQGDDTVIDLGSVCILKGQYWKNPMAVEVLDHIKGRGGVLFLTDISQEEV